MRIAQMTKTGTRRTTQIRRIGLGLLVASFLTACSTTPKPPPVNPQQQQLKAAIAQRNPQQIAQARMALAEQLKGESRAQQQMRAIETAIDAEDYPLAQQLYTRADTQALWSGISPQRAALLSGFHEWRQDQPLNALNTVRNLPVPLTQAESRRRLLLLADIFSSMGQYLDAARQRSALDDMLAGDQADRNRKALWHDLGQVPVKQLADAMKQATDPSFADWLSLALLDRTRPGELSTWIQNHPQHSAVTSGFAQNLLKKGQTYSVNGPSGSGPIVVLLPLNGNYKTISSAIEKGMKFARQRLGLDTNRPLKFIDSGLTPADLSQALNQAYAEQPSIIIGPLLKPQLPALKGRPDNSIPVLALNAPDDGSALPSGVISFSLSPEEESRSAADRMIADHHMHALLFAADNDLGHRIAGAWAREYTLLGGTIVDQDFYQPDETDFSGQLRDLLQVETPKKGPFQPTIRNDVDTIFLGGTGPQIAMIVPQLDYFGANELPRYATSLAYSGNPNQLVDQDKDGLIIPVEPLLLAANADPSNPLRTTWEQASLDTQLPRLFGFGADAMLIATHLPQLIQHQTLQGLTGKLSLTGNGVVDRKAAFGQFRNGLLRPASKEDTGPQPSTVLTTEPDGQMSDSSDAGTDDSGASTSTTANGTPDATADGTAPAKTDAGDSTSVDKTPTIKLTPKVPTFTDGGGLAAPDQNNP